MLLPVVLTPAIPPGLLQVLHKPCNVPLLSVSNVRHVCINQQSSFTLCKQGRQCTHKMAGLHFILLDCYWRALQRAVSAISVFLCAHLMQLRHMELLQSAYTGPNADAVSAGGGCAPRVSRVELVQRLLLAPSIFLPRAARFYSIQSLLLSVPAICVCYRTPVCCDPLCIASSLCRPVHNTVD